MQRLHDGRATVVLFGDGRCNCARQLTRCSLHHTADHPSSRQIDFGGNEMFRMLSIAALAAGAFSVAPAEAGPGVVLQGPSVSGFAVYRAGGGTGNSCPTWRCGFNGTERSGLVLPPVSGFSVYRADGGGNACPTWRCGLNGTERGGLVSLPAAPTAQQPVTARPTTTGDAFIATGITLVNGTFIPLD